mmetsp:Transcript_1506/g.3914  ORF Transcript_1506/g.3914 Transcript_1506/m.3914 type:complete len:395 (-) Transcript_1506:223-1407(-)
MPRQKLRSESPSGLLHLGVEFACCGVLLLGRELLAFAMDVLVRHFGLLGVHQPRRGGADNVGPPKVQQGLDNSLAVGRGHRGDVGDFSPTHPPRAPGNFAEQLGARPAGITPVRVDVRCGRADPASVMPCHCRDVVQIARHPQPTLGPADPHVERCELVDVRCRQHGKPGGQRRVARPSNVVRHSGRRRVVVNKFEIGRLDRNFLPRWQPDRCPTRGGSADHGDHLAVELGCLEPRNRRRATNNDVRRLEAGLGAGKQDGGGLAVLPAKRPREIHCNDTVLPIRCAAGLNLGDQVHRLDPVGHVLDLSDVGVVLQDTRHVLRGLGLAHNEAPLVEQRRELGTSERPHHLAPRRRLHRKGRRADVASELPLITLVKGWVGRLGHQDRSLPLAKAR